MRASNPFSSNMLMWILPGVTFLVGAGFLAAAFMVFKFFPPIKKDRHHRIPSTPDPQNGSGHSGWNMVA